MNKLVTTFIVLVLGFINAYSAYNIEIVDKYVNGTCKASFLITLDGDAGPFQVAMYDNDGNILYNESDLLNGLHTIPNIDMQSNLRIRISDAYGCGTQFDDLDFDCGCSNVVPTVEITQELCNTFGGAISISPIANMHAISLVWQDDNSTKLTRKDLSEGTYFAEFTFMPLTTQQGPLTPTAVSDYCTSVLSFDIGPCKCDEYNPIVEIKDATNGNDGSIFIELEHGQEPITYDWFQRETGLTFSGDYITNLTPGTYDVTITDSSCRDEPQIKTYIINQICNLEINGVPNVVNTPTGCNAEDGMIYQFNADFYNFIFGTTLQDGLTIENGTPPYEWIWKDSNGKILKEIYHGDDDIFLARGLENLKSGSYELTIMDSKGCSDEIEIVVESYETDMNIIVRHIRASCLGYNNGGRITFKVFSENNPSGMKYSFVKKSPFEIIELEVFFKSDDIVPTSIVESGDYFIVVNGIDDNCIKRYDFTIDEITDPLNNLPNLFLLDVTKPYCLESGTPLIAEAFINDNTNGNPPFYITPPGILTNLKFGINDFRITDKCGWLRDYEVEITCTGEQPEGFILTNPVCCSFEYESIVTEPTNNNSNGSILVELEESNCSSSASIYWLHNASNEFLQEGLAPGIYDAILSNEFCETSLSFELGSCNTSSFNLVVYQGISQVTCTQLSGANITVNLRSIINDEDGFEYKLINNGQIIRFGTKWIDKNENTALKFEGLPDGNYQLFFKHNDSCEWFLVHNWKLGCLEPECTENSQGVTLEYNQPCGSSTIGGFITTNQQEYFVLNNTNLPGEYLIYHDTGDDKQHEVTYIRNEPNGENVWIGPDEIEFEADYEERYIGISVYDLQNGCIYSIKKLVGLEDLHCESPRLTVQIFVSTPTFFNLTDDVIAGVERSYACGEFGGGSSEEFTFKPFDFFPFDVENPCTGGGILKVPCGEEGTYDYLGREFFHRGEQYYTILPSENHEKFTDYNSWYSPSDERYYFNCDNDEKALCIFDVLNDKLFPIVAEYCGGPSVIQPEGYEVDCGDDENSITYALPEIITDPVTGETSSGCSFNVYCIQYDPILEKWIQDPDPIDYKRITECCVYRKEKEDEPGEDCILICECDLGFYQAVERTEVSCATSNSILSCNDDLRILSYQTSEGFPFVEYLCEGFIQVEFYTPESCEIEFYFTKYDGDCNDIPINLLENRKKEDFEIGEHQYTYYIPDHLGDGDYAFTVKCGDKVDCFSITIDDCILALQPPTGCNTDLASSNHNDPTFIPFANTFTQGTMPAVITGPLSYNGADPATVRVQQISPDGFDLQLEEWDYRDGAHVTENVSFFYAEPGIYNFGGLKAEVGFIESVTHEYKTIEFNTVFSTQPVVLTTVVSNNDAMTVSRRVTNVSGSGFQMRLQEQSGQNINLAHAPERIAYIAIEKGEGSFNGKRIVVGSTGNAVNHNWSTTTFNQSFSQSPLVLADMQTVNGADLAVVRYNNLSGSSVQFLIEEEKSQDVELAHNSEDVGYIIIESDGRCDCDEESINLADTQFLHAYCNTPNGSISISPTGSGPFTFEWAHGATTGILTDLAGGDYFVTVTDANGCTATRAFDINMSPRLGLYSNVDHPDCNTDNGAISLYPYGGDAPFTYNWDNGATVSSLTGLAKGEHKVTVTDINGCWVKETFYLRELNFSEYEIGDAVCGQDNGSILGQANLGQPPYTYAWDNGATTRELRDLAAGNYRLTITDALGCIAIKTFNIQNYNTLNYNSSGGDEGFSDGKFLEAGTQLTWWFVPYTVADQLEIISDVEGHLLNTGAVSAASSCTCDGNINCNCSFVFLGDIPGQTINLLVGEGTVSDAIGNCSNGIGAASAGLLSGQVTLTQDAYITIDVSGSVCGVNGTSWILDVTCGTGSTLNPIDPDLIESMALLESYNQESKLNNKNDIDSQHIDKDLIDFKIYPNPANNTVSLQILEDKLPYNLRVLDVNGRVIIDSKNISDVIYTFNVSELPKGLYLVDVISQNMRHVKRLIVN